MKRSILATVFLLTTFYLLLSAAPAGASAADDLRKAIEEKAKGLLEINNQIQATQKQIEQTQSQQKSLSKEIKTIDYGINQLNLGIKSSQINIEKLGLELQEVQLDINQINASVGTKKLALIILMRELYEKDGEGSLMMLLKNRSLAESVLENESIASLNNGISTEVTNLKELGQQLDGKFQTTSSKKKKIEVENSTLKNRKNIVADQKTERQQLLTQTKSQEKVYALVLDDLSKKQADISAEIEKIEKELRASIDPSLLPIPRPGVLAMPAAGVMTQDYGATAFAKYGYKGQFHNGVDIGAPIGSEVWSAEDGTVVAIGDQDQLCYRGAYGKFIVVQHDNNLTTLYAHLSRFGSVDGQLIKKGDIVKRGQLIGYVGRTGYATGPHLHFTVYAAQTFYMGASRVCGSMPFGGDLNPRNYL
ncbi:MAG: peptidoglycan DD-metalloendopeptidase family protein [bacterium]|nr:peptidoglycan DD-metalloendopeptidase family protein [bacterium]